VADGRQAFVLTFVMAGEGGGSVIWLRVGDEDTDEAKHLRLRVSAVDDGKGKKKRKRYQCKRQLEGGALGGLQALRCGAQCRPAALRGCSAGPEAEVAGGLSKSEKEAGGR